MFNKRDQAEDTQPQQAEQTKSVVTKASTPATSNSASTSTTATIGASVHITGEVHGEENLVIEGQVNGTVKLKSHTLTVGQNGKVEAEVFAHSVIIDGMVIGDVLAAEQVSIRKSARVQGNLIAPRVSLEDGAKFRGSIDMDTESEHFRKVFAQPTSITPAADAKPPKANTPTEKKPEQVSSPDKVSGAA